MRKPSFVKTSEGKTAKSSSAKASTSVKTSSFAEATEDKSEDREPETMDDLMSETKYAMVSYTRGKVLDGKVMSVSNRFISFDIGGKGDAIVHEKEIPYIGDLLRHLKVGDKVAVTVVNPENDRGQTVVSLRRTALSKRWELLIEKMKSGEIVDVAIKELSKGGFLVDYLGIRGFIPLSQVDAELTRTGERSTGRHVNVKIIEVDKDANRLIFSQIAGGISVKQQAALKALKIGDTYKAEITGIAPFGGFVSVKSGESNISGLIHISEIAWEKVDNTSNYLKIGQTVDAKLIGIDQKLGKLTLSLKQLLADPWSDVMKVFSVDQSVKGKVTKITPFGAFVSLLPGIEGLIHISKIAPGEEPKSGEDIECLIEELNPDKRKISLSIVSKAKPIGYR